MKAGQPIIVFNELSIGYNEVLLNVPDFRFSAGELVSILGKNGAGKSTLLRTIAGLQKPAKGSVKLMGAAVNALGAKDRARMLSFVITNAPNNALRVSELVALGRYPWLGFFGTQTQKDKDVVREAMRKAHVLEFANKRLHQLSDGEQQRVLIAKSLAQNGTVLLLDEPSAYLDVQNKIELMHMLRKISAEENKCVLLSSHDLQLALDFSDKLLVLEDEDCHLGTPQEIISKGILQKLFGDNRLDIDANGRVTYK